MRRLEVRQAVARELAQLVLGGAGARFEDHEGVWRLAPSLVGQPDDSGFLDSRVAQQHAFHFDGRDVLAPADDDVFDPVADLDVPVRMNDGAIARVKPAALERFGRGLGIVVVALHHHVAANHDLAHGLTIPRHLAAAVVDDRELARGDQLHALTRLQDCAFLWRQARMFGPRLTDGDEGCGLGQSVDVNDLPAEVVLDTADGGRCRRCARGENPQPSAHTLAELGWRVGHPDQDGWRGTQHRNLFCVDQLEDSRWLDASQADVPAANRGDHPDKCPAVAVEHRQRPQVRVAGGHRHVRERSNRVDVRVAVGDHHALRSGRRTARVVDAEQIAFADLRLEELAARATYELLIVQPAVACAFERNEVLDVRNLVTNAVDRVQVIGMGTHHPGAAVADDVGKVVGDQPVVDRHQHGAELRHGVEGFELRMRVRRDVRHAVAVADPEFSLQDL